MPKPQHLGITGIAQYLGVPINTVYGWKYRGQLPTPDGYVGASAFWLSTTIDKWQRPGIKAVKK